MMKRPKRRKLGRSLSTLIEAADDDTVTVTRDHGRYMTAPVGPAPPRPAVIPPGVVAVKQPGRDTHPLAFRGAPVPGRAALPPSAGPAPLAITATPATPAQDALTHICLRVKALALKGQLDRVSDEKLADVAARRRDGLRQPRTTAKVIIDEALELLRDGREPWTPDSAA
jgi:hypothetical protein